MPKHVRFSDVLKIQQIPNRDDLKEDLRQELINLQHSGFPGAAQEMRELIENSQTTPKASRQQVMQMDKEIAAHVDREMDPKLFQAEKVSITPESQGGNSRDQVRHRAMLNSIVPKDRRPLNSDKNLELLAKQNPGTMHGGNPIVDQLPFSARNPKGQPLKSALKKPSHQRPRQPQSQQLQSQQLQSQHPQRQQYPQPRQGGSGQSNLQQMRGMSGSQGNMHRVGGGGSNLQQMSRMSGSAGNLQSMSGSRMGGSMGGSMVDFSKLGGATSAAQKQQWGMSSFKASGNPMANVDKNELHRQLAKQMLSGGQSQSRKGPKM